MALYNRGSLDPAASIGSQGYKRAASLQQRADLEPARRQAGLEMQDELGSRGLSRGGASMAAGLAQRSSFLQQLLQNEQKLGMMQAGAGEENRQRLEGRGWNLEDQAAQAAYEDQIMKQEADDYAAYRRMLPMKKLMGGIGKLGGMAASSYFSQGGNDIGKPGGPPAQDIDYDPPSMY